MSYFTFEVSANQVLLNPAIGTNHSEGTVRIEDGNWWQNNQYTVRFKVIGDEVNQLSSTNSLMKVELLDSDGNIVQTLVPMNPGQVAPIQSDMSGISENHVRFDMGGMVDQATGQLFVGSLAIIGCGYSSNQIPFSFPWIDNTFNLELCKPINPCFVLGLNRVLTQRGLVDIGHLNIGDKIWTMDDGYQPICGISTKTYTDSQLIENPDLMPYQYDMEGMTVMLSKHHRIVTSSECMISAHHLNHTNNRDVNIVDWYGDLTYINLFLEKHQVINVNGIMVESGFLGGTMKELLSVRTECWKELQRMKNSHTPARRFINHKRIELLG